MAKPDEFSDQRRQRQNRYFSNSFKKKRVREIERNLTTVTDISREYEVTRAAVYKWIYKFSLMRKKGVKQVVELLSDTKKIQMLKDQVKELEQIVGQKQIQIEFQEKMIELAEEKYQVDIKKKLGSQLFTGSGKTGRNTIGK
jgi:transposase-like protein